MVSAENSLTYESTASLLPRQRSGLSWFPKPRGSCILTVLSRTPPNRDKDESEVEQMKAHMVLVSHMGRWSEHVSLRLYGMMA